MRSKMIVVAALILTLTLGTLPALAGGLKSSQLDAQLGLRFTSRLPDKVQAGKSVEAVVVDQAKLAKFGINAKNGEKLKLTVTEENKAFFIPSGRTQVHFNIDQSGVVRRNMQAPAAK